MINRLAGTSGKRGDIPKERNQSTRRSTSGGGQAPPLQTPLGFKERGAAASLLGTPHLANHTRRHDSSKPGPPQCRGRSILAPQRLGRSSFSDFTAPRSGTGRDRVWPLRRAPARPQTHRPIARTTPTGANQPVHHVGIDRFSDSRVSVGRRFLNLSTRCGARRCVSVSRACRGAGS